MNNFALEVERLTVSFDGFKAVDDVSFYLTRGTVHVVIGPNGAGKTTLLDLICGKTKPTSGSIRFEGTELTKLAEQDIVKAGVGRKFQTPSIYPELTVRENLEVSYPAGRTVLGSILFRKTPEIEARIREVADEIMLGDKLDTPGELLSHGQKQWLEIGMLLIADPKLILLDEPVAGMTIEERHQTALLLDKIRKRRSVLVIEHDMNFVRAIADRVTVLHHGKVIAEGSMKGVETNKTVIDVYLGH